VPHVSIMRLKGDPDQLMATKQEKMDPVTMRVAPENGGMLHIAAKTDEGIVIVNLWETAEGSQATANDPEVAKAREESGIQPDQIQWEQYEVEQFEQPSP